MFKIYNIYFMSFVLAISLFILFTNHIYADGKVVATVNGISIKEDALLVEVNKKLPLGSFHLGVSDEKLQEFRKQALEKLIEDELFYQEAKRQKIALDLFEVEQQISFMKSGFPTEKAFQQNLAKSGLNSLSLMEHLKRKLLIKKIVQKEILDKVTMTDSVLRTYYEINKSKFIRPERRQLRHILISVKPGAMSAGWNTGQEKAQQIYKRIMDGEDFAQVAGEVSADSSSREKGGAIGWFHKGQLIPELEEALANMKIGEVSQPVLSIYGFHILKLEEIKPATQLTFDQINRQELKKKFTKKQIETLRKNYISKLKAKSDIRIFES